MSQQVLLLIQFMIKEMIAAFCVLVLSDQKQNSGVFWQLFMERWNSQADGEIGSRDAAENKDSYLFPPNTDAEREMPWELNPKHCLYVRTVCCVQGNSVSVSGLEIR